MATCWPSRRPAPDGSWAGSVPVVPDAGIKWPASTGGETLPDQALRAPRHAAFGQSAGQAPKRKTAREGAVFMGGGASRSRTGLDGFAIRCITALLSRRGRHCREKGKPWLPSFKMRGAGNESRTRDLNLGKVALYQLSYSRIARLQAADPRQLAAASYRLQASPSSEDKEYMSKSARLTSVTDARPAFGLPPALNAAKCRCRWRGLLPRWPPLRSELPPHLPPRARAAGHSPARSRAHGRSSARE